MTNKICTSALVGAFSMAFIGSAFAGAELSAIKGQVLVNSGAGYVASSGVSDLKSGTRIMVSPNSTAVLKFSDGCSVPLNAGVVTIGSKSPCSFKAADLPDRGEPSDRGIVPPVVGGPGISTGTLLAVGAGVGALGLGIYLVNKKTSP